MENQTVENLSQDMTKSQNNPVISGIPSDILSQEPTTIELETLLTSGMRVAPKISSGVKICLWLAGILSCIGVFVYAGASFYESNHDCTFQVSWSYAFCDRGDFAGQSFSPSIYSDPACDGCAVPFKPLILLYPERNTEVQVKLTYAPGFSATYPQYSEEKQGWHVTAYPDGTLFEHLAHQDAYGLFWEGNSSRVEYDLSQGWIMKGNEVREFLYDKLTLLGLNTKEKSDFIMFWYPKLQVYPYLQITFAGEDYTKQARLQIVPKPNSLLRIFMVAKPLDHWISLPPQKLEHFERKGFSVVEWGGTIVE